jgi:hypothetical protein
MAFWNVSSRDKDQVLGEQAAEQIAAQGYTADSVNWNMVERIAQENGLDTQAFAYGVQAALEGEVWCAECRCTMPPIHQHID